MEPNSETVHCSAKWQAFPIIGDALINKSRIEYGMAHDSNGMVNYKFPYVICPDNLD